MSEGLVEQGFENDFEDLSFQMQMFSKAPTKQAWDIIEELHSRVTVKLHPDYDRVREKIGMFRSAVLARHPEWALCAEDITLRDQWPVRRKWLLSESGDCVRKLDHIWNAYFATGDEAFPLKIAEVSDTLNYSGDLREIAIRIYFIIASSTYPELQQLCPNVYSIGQYMEKERLKKL